MDIKKNLQLSLLLALMVIIGIIESVIPFFNGMIPGVKLGLANSIVIFILYKYTFKDALSISILRVFLMGIIRTGLFSVTFFFSLSGAIFSIILMYLFKKTNKFSIIGVSVIGSASHSFGQLLMAFLMLKSPIMLNYTPFIILLSIPTGIVVGAVGKELVKYSNN